MAPLQETFGCDVFPPLEGSLGPVSRGKASDRVHDRDEHWGSQFLKRVSYGTVLSLLQNPLPKAVQEIWMGHVPLFSAVEDKGLHVLGSYNSTDTGPSG